MHTTQQRSALPRANTAFPAVALCAAPAQAAIHDDAFSPAGMGAAMDSIFFTGRIGIASRGDL